METFSLATDDSEKRVNTKHEVVNIRLALISCIFHLNPFLNKYVFRRDIKRHARAATNNRSNVRI